MKCQHCEKPATFHITELLEGGQPKELHLCEEHARQYLTQPDPEETPTSASAFAGQLAQQFKVGQTAEDLARLDQQACPVCGITFYEFRQAGRLGCPHDYVRFEDELDPLIVNIHGERKHEGKQPKHHKPQTASQQTELIRLRREMKEAVDEENYERASKLRDEIRRIEQGDA